MSGKIQVIVVLLLFAGGLTAIGIATYSNRVQKIDTELVKEVKLEKAPVETQVAVLQNLTERLVATGVLVADQDITLTAEVGGEVKKVTKSLGDYCKKGELIVRLDAESYNLAMRQAKAALSQSEVSLEYAAREWERMKKLKGSEVASESRIDSAEGNFSANKAAVDSAKAAVAVAARNLKETNVKCPFSGYIAERMVDPGASITPGMPLARLVDLGRLSLTISVTSDKLARLKVGQKAVLSDPALPDRTYVGEVSRLGVAADSVTRTFPVEVELVEKHADLRAGQVVQASLALQTFENVTAVPSGAVQKSLGPPRIVIVEGGKAKVRTVTLGQEIDDLVIVTSGVKPNDEVVVVGGSELRDDIEVAVTRRIPHSNDVVTTAEAAPKDTGGASTAGASASPENKTH